MVYSLGITFTGVSFDVMRVVTCVEKIGKINVTISTIEEKKPGIDKQLQKAINFPDYAEAHSTSSRN